ncbi:MAG TPA: hypothetical protein VH442_19200 [Micromonosporaceae bacterium]
MRTTIDIPDDLLAVARSIARGRNQTLGQAVAEMMRRSLSVPVPEHDIAISPRTGLPVIHLELVPTASSGVSP